MPLNPLAWAAPDFLLLYLGLVLAAVAALLLGPETLRPHGRRRAVTDPDEAAYLAGGVDRLVEAAVTARLADGRLAMPGGRRFAAAPGTGLPERADWPALVRAIEPRAARTRHALEQDGLFVDAGTFAAMRRWIWLPDGAVLLFGAIRLARGLILDHPVGVLAIMMLALLGGLAARLHGLNRSTRAGRAALAALRDGSDRLRRAPTRGEMALAVALFGTTVLVGSDLTAFHQSRAGDSGGGDGGGCGGGGCGG